MAFIKVRHKVINTDHIAAVYLRYDESVKVIPEGFQRKQLLKRDTVIVVTGNSDVLPFFEDDADILRHFFVRHSKDLFASPKKDVEEPVLDEERAKDDYRIKMTI